MGCHNDTRAILVDGSQFVALAGCSEVLSWSVALRTEAEMGESQMKCDVHYRCACHAELKLENYDIQAALSYAQEWWEQHQSCDPREE